MDTQINKQTNKRYKLTETKRNKEDHGRKLNKRKKAKANKQSYGQEKEQRINNVLTSTTIPF